MWCLPTLKAEFVHPVLYCWDHKLSQELGGGVRWGAEEERTHLSLLKRECLHFIALMYLSNAKQNTHTKLELSLISSVPERPWGRWPSSFPGERLQQQWKPHVGAGDTHSSFSQVTRVSDFLLTLPFT